MSQIIIHQEVENKNPKLQESEDNNSQNISKIEEEIGDPTIPDQIKYSDDEQLNNFILYDEDLNSLQSSLLKEGFSVSTITKMLVDVAKTKIEKQTFDKDFEENKKRLLERIDLWGLKEKSEIPADGNCLFYSVSDQLFNSIEHHTYIRNKCVGWLRANKNWKIPNGAILSDFSDTDDWTAYCDHLSKNGIWGNHLTLIAIAESFGSRIRIISSVKDTQYYTEIDPTNVNTDKVILLAHYAEYHYISITWITPKIYKN